MTEFFLQPGSAEAASLDQADRAAVHARHCVTLAAVAPLSIAGELIDKAIKLRAAERRARKRAASNL